MGHQVGSRLLDLVFVREKAAKRETKLLNVLLFVKSTLWKTLFGKEADKLEHANDDERTYYIIEKEPLVNKFISVPKDKGMVYLEFDKFEFWDQMTVFCEKKTTYVGFKIFVWFVKSCFDFLNWTKWVFVWLKHTFRLPMFPN